MTSGVTLPYTWLNNYQRINLRMLSILLVVAALAGTAVSSGPYKCDYTIIKKITDYWQGNVPLHILKYAEGKTVLWGTSANFLPYPVQGVVSFTKVDCFGKGTSNVIEYLKNGTTLTSEVKLVERPGITIDYSTNTWRYFLKVGDGLFAYYACSKSCTAKPGPPVAVIVVKPSEYNECKVSQLVNTFKCLLGITITDTYTYCDLE